MGCGVTREKSDGVFYAAGRITKRPAGERHVSDDQRKKIGAMYLLDFQDNVPGIPIVIHVYALVKNPNPGCLGIFLGWVFVD